MTKIVSGTGFYKSYACYRNETHKIPARKRKDYAFPFVDNEYAVVKPGDSSPVDGQIVTEQHIEELHRMRDRECEQNLKFRYQKFDDYDYLCAIEAEKQKKKDGLPSRYEEMKNEMNRIRFVVNTGSLVDDEGNDITERMRSYEGFPSVEAQLGLNVNTLEDAFMEVFGSLTENEYEVAELVWIERLPSVVVAKMLGVSEATVRYRLDKAKKKFLAHPEVIRHLAIRAHQTERLNQWAKDKKEKKKQYEKIREQNKKFANG